MLQTILVSSRTFTDHISDKLSGGQIVQWGMLFSKLRTPIEEFFAELKGLIRRNWSYYAEDPDREFSSFLERCINQVGAREANARGHFRHAGLTIEESDN